MLLLQVPQPWLPSQLHGEVPFPYGADAEATIIAEVKKSVIPSQIPSYSAIKYCVQFNLDGSQSIFFELVN